MQFSQKTFGSQNAIKQLYRQYSGTFKNNDSENNRTMTQSSNLPFDKICNAFNSTGNMKTFTLDKFKHSEAKSIIEKLMQTREIQKNNKDEELILFNQIQTLQNVNSKQAFTLTKTEAKIFYQVVNLINQIWEIKEKTQIGNEQMLKIKYELKNQGIEIPLLEEIKPEINNRNPKRYSNEQLRAIYEENDNLTLQIQKLTKQLINKNDSQNEQHPTEKLIKENSLLQKQLSKVRIDIMNAGQIDQKDSYQLNLKVQELRKNIFFLQQKRLDKLTDKDEEVRFLKNQNQKLRLKTIQILKNFNNPLNKRKQEYIRLLKHQENNKKLCSQAINQLKCKYQSLLLENSILKRQNMLYNQNPLQVESKVSPFHNSYGQYQSVYGFNKDNYLSNFQPQMAFNHTSNLQKYELYSNYVEDKQMQNQDFNNHNSRKYHLGRNGNNNNNGGYSRTHHNNETKDFIEID